MWKRITTSARTDSVAVGADIEHRASRWLQQQGLTQLQCNYRCKVGEIDIIMLDQQQLVFVEVRYRKHGNFGNGAESVDWRKQKKLIKAASHFLLDYPEQAHRNCRFDVVAAQGRNDATLHWSWISDAFSA